MNGTWHTKVLSTESNAEFATSPSSYYRVFWLSGSLGWACRVPWPQLNSQYNLLLPSNCNAGGLAVEIPVLKSFSVLVFPLFPPSFCDLPLRSRGEPFFGTRFCLATPCCWRWSPSTFVHLWPTSWRYVEVILHFTVCSFSLASLMLALTGDFSSFLMLSTLPLGGLSL